MDKNRIQGLLRLLREIQSIHPEFPLQYAVCLAEIALNEGISLTGLAQQTGLSLPTISRIITALGRTLGNPPEQGRHYGLIYVQIAACEKRRKELFLSPKGRHFMEQVSGVFEEIN